jgi:excisionase family DNA binding protein
MEKILFTRREVAELIGLSTASVVALTKSGQLPTVKLGRYVRVSAETLAKFARTGTLNRTTTGAPLSELWQGK